MIIVFPLLTGFRQAPMYIHIIYIYTYHFKPPPRSGSNFETFSFQNVHVPKRKRVGCGGKQIDFDPKKSRKTWRICHQKEPTLNSFDLLVEDGLFYYKLVSEMTQALHTNSLPTSPWVPRLLEIDPNKTRFFGILILDPTTPCVH